MLRRPSAPECISKSQKRDQTKNTMRKNLDFLENSDFVANARIAQFPYSQARFEDLGIGQGFVEFTHRFDSHADDAVGLDIEAALVNQKTVHHGVEIGIVGHVVDVAIDVIVRPSGLNAQKMGVAVPGFDVLFTHVTGCPWKSKGRQIFWGPPSTGSPHYFVASNLSNSPEFFNARDITQGRTRRSTLAKEINRQAKPVPCLSMIEIKKAPPPKGRRVQQGGVEVEWMMFLSHPLRHPIQDILIFI